MDRSDDNAITVAGEDRSVSYATLQRQSRQFAQLLRERGFAAGDRVAIIMENCSEWLVAAWGIRRAGMRFVPVNWHLKPSEIHYVLDNCDARGAVTSKTLATSVLEAAEGIDIDRLRLAVGRAHGFEDFAATLDRIEPVILPYESDGDAMVYSSGTTGKPKGILRALPGTSFGTPSALEAMLRERYAIDKKTIYLCPAPLYHAAPVSWTSAVLSAGGRVIVMTSFDAEKALAAIEAYKVTHAQFVPTHFTRMLRLPPRVRQRYDLSSLTRVIHAAAPCPPNIKRQMIDWMGPIVHEYYSGSERCGFTDISSTDWLAHPGSVGRPVNGAIHILDPDNGKELPTGEIGCVYFTNPTPFSYHKNSAKTEAVFNGAGLGTFGDLGHIDDQGYLYLADRRSDLIISGGVNIYPQEIENRMLEHASVADVAVIGRRHEEYGQQVVAIVQLASDRGGATAEELAAFCNDGLARFKVPRDFIFVRKLPRMPSGKLLRRELVDRYGSRL